MKKSGVFRVEADQLDKDVADQLTTSRRLGDLTTTVPRSVVVVDRFRIELERIIEHCRHREDREITPSDIDYDGLSIDELDEILDAF